MEKIAGMDATRNKENATGKTIKRILLYIMGRLSKSLLEEATREPPFVRFSTTIVSHQGATMLL